MSKFVEFEVVIPFGVFDHLTATSIDDLLSWFNVKFERKGVTDAQVEFLVVAPSVEVASAVRNVFISLKRLVVASAYSPMDKLRCSSNWLFGAFCEFE